MIIVQGDTMVAGELVKAATTAPKRAGVVVAKTAKNVENTSKSLAPVRSGQLRASINSQVSGTTATVEAPIRYAFFMEHGTYKDAPQAYMGPALDRHSGEFVKELEEMVGELR